MRTKTSEKSLKDAQEITGLFHGCLYREARKKVNDIYGEGHSDGIQELKDRLEARLIKQEAEFQKRQRKIRRDLRKGLITLYRKKR